ncbi:dolichol-phosphate mannosyltransferase [Actinorhabdospora filicis]|uniref:Dolichol-phosphate mannosyltransferase n=1 Tax=Actinorhabdospora filicis TaxID=1785913 RepID=A0A9W6SN03_9ACTN|nr:polyprenol monophosphomannose synthase [Actinorhabdospora filicis]GLZ78870.1 dolichol-phosphate mannosyltransferase [Actinorhabdospora filicis]
MTTTPAGEDYPRIGKVLVIIPTYNEKDNVESIVARTRAAVPVAHILVADDNSPDGTGDIADGLAAADANVHVLHRAGKEGLGMAYLAGFAWAREHGYDVVVEMDADGSHAPEQLHRLLDALGEADAVIGSRYVPGGKVVNWPAHRLLLSRGGSLYTRILLGVPVRDTTAGYRAYRLDALDKFDLGTVASAGYCFQIDLTWRAVRAGLRVVEVPITFAERERGASKMGGSIVREALLRVGSWGVKHRAGQVASLFGGKDKARR